jgi:hypothetical protein
MNEARPVLPATTNSSIVFPLCPCALSLVAPAHSIVSAIVTQPGWIPDGRERGLYGSTRWEGDACKPFLKGLPSATQAFLRWITMGLIWAGILIFLPPAQTDIVTLYLLSN